ncbi:Asparagine--tRNA ligase [Euphorbia peplus]|nr:Asparagine--tRNA ligase [Euphorbia peplus]
MGDQQLSFSDRIPIRSIVNCPPDEQSSLIGRRVRVGGWVKTGRKQEKGAFAFLELNDGSSTGNLQLMVDKEVADLTPLVHTGACVSVEGVLKEPPEGVKQKVELKVEKVLHVGPVDPGKYPIPKTKLTLEFLRDHIHLRPRTNTIASVARIRNALSFATHSFFQDHGFLYIQTPIITTSDCEGAGEAFQVTTLINEVERIKKELADNPPPSASDIEAAELIVKKKGEAVAELKSAKASKEDINAAVALLKQAKEDHSKLKERSELKPGLPEKDGKIDYSQDFFARQAFLTVSGQLQAETYACALGNVYTFGPTFRAENSHTSRHLAEFWMVEPEMAFANLENDMDCAEAYVKYMFDLLVKAVKGGKKFENNVEWGIDLASEHERYLTEVLFKKPVIVYNYPKGIKAFYMRLNDDLKTVAAMDVLVPKVGELIGGSQREERLDVLEQRMAELGLAPEPYEFYLDLRRYGTVQHSGFGLGFERMVLFATGIDNIRDVMPFPRYPGRADL